MNILFITNNYLSSKGGASYASRAYINAFAEIADEMTLCYPVKEGEGLYDTINKKISTIAFSYDKSKFSKLLDLLIGKVHRYFALPKTLQTKFDIVVFDTSIVSYKLIGRFKRQGAKCIVIHHNYQYEYFRDNTQLLLKPLVLFWCKKYEKQSVALADLNLTLTKQDIKLLQENYDKNGMAKYGLLGVFEDISKPQKQPNETSFLSRFIITGSLNSIQTEKSLVPWLQKYFPLLKKVYPNCQLIVAGKKPSEKIKNLCKDLGIDVEDTPPVMEPLIQKSDVYLCPTKLGGGLKLRIMDGLKCGLPVVTHEVSARGYDFFIEKKMVFSYKDSNSFIAALRQIQSNSHSRKEIFDAYQSQFSFESGVKRLRDCLNIL